MPQKTWQFIVTDGGPTNAASQKIVRQNAMRSFRRGERQAGTRKHLLSKESKRQQEVFDRDERALEDSAPEPQARSCVLKLNAGRIDPFSSTMLGGSRDAERLFTHCRSTHFR